MSRTYDAKSIGVVRLHKHVLVHLDVEELARDGDIRSSLELNLQGQTVRGEDPITFINLYKIC